MQSMNHISLDVTYTVTHCAGHAHQLTPTLVLSNTCILLRCTYPSPHGIIMSTFTHIQPVMLLTFSPHIHPSGALLAAALCSNLLIMSGRYSSWSFFTITACQKKTHEVIITRLWPLFWQQSTNTLPDPIDSETCCDCPKLSHHQYSSQLEVHKVPTCVWLCGCTLKGKRTAFTLLPFSSHLSHGRQLHRSGTMHLQWHPLC